MTCSRPHLRSAVTDSPAHFAENAPRDGRSAPALPGPAAPGREDEMDDPLQTAPFRQHMHQTTVCDRFAADAIGQDRNAQTSDRRVPHGRQVGAAQAAAARAARAAAVLRLQMPVDLLGLVVGREQRKLLNCSTLCTWLATGGLATRMRVEVPSDRMVSAASLVEAQRTRSARSIRSSIRSTARSVATS